MRPTRARSVPPALVGRPGRLSESLGSAVSEAAASAGAPLEGLTLKVVGRRCALFHRPDRSEIRRVAVWDTGLHDRSFSASRSSAGRSSSAARAGQQVLVCGLFEHEVCDLLYRDITPEDYDLLLRLDERVAKKTAPADALARLQAVPLAERRHGTCGVCLAAFGENDEDVVSVPCPAEHEFHRECVSKWLLQCKNTCPLDHTELW